MPFFNRMDAAMLKSEARKILTDEELLKGNVHPDMYDAAPVAKLKTVLKEHFAAQGKVTTKAYEFGIEDSILAVELRYGREKPFRERLQRNKSNQQRKEILASMTDMFNMTKSNKDARDVEVEQLKRHINVVKNKYTGLIQNDMMLS